MKREQRRQLYREVSGACLNASGKFEKNERRVRDLINVLGLIPPDTASKTMMRDLVEREASRRGAESARKVLEVVIEEYFTENPDVSRVVLRATGCLDRNTKEIEQRQAANDLIEVMAVTMLDMLMN